MKKECQNNFSFSLRFSGDFSNWTRDSRYQNVSISGFIGANWMMNVVVTTGAITRAKLQSNRHHQQTSIQLYYRPDALPVA